MKTKTAFYLLISVLSVGMISCEGSDKVDPDLYVKRDVLADSLEKWQKNMLSPFAILEYGPVMDGIINTAKEDELMFEKLRIHSITAEQDIEHSYHALTVETGKKLGLLAATIPTLALKSMYDLAKVISCGPITYSVTGVRIYYGLSTDYKKLQLYYQPVAFCRKDLFYGQGGGRYGKYDASDNGKYYKYVSGNAFTEVAVDEKDEAFARYKDNTNGIRMVRGSQSDRFIDKTSATDIQGDVESITFSFQEIFVLAESAANKGNIVLWNSLESLSTGRSMQLMKHILVLSSEDVEVNAGNASDLSVPAAGANFLNLSHICPPSCNGLSYSFEIAYP